MFLLFSCFKERENEVNVNNIDDRIHVGMTKEDLKKEIGEPADSIKTSNRLGKYEFMYFTNDFTDYRLYIYFDENDKIISYSID